jgi:hypothetical protein
VLTSVSGALVKEYKKKKICIENYIFYTLKK